MNTLLKRTLLKSALLLPLALTPVLALAADHGGRGGGFREHSSHNSWRGPVHVVRPRVSIGLGIGYGVGLGYLGYSAFGAPYSPYYYGYPGYYSPRTVVVEHNTYVEPADDYSSPAARNETSLLRDLQGRCYRRSFDRNGNELRTELDPSECNF